MGHAINVEPIPPWGSTLPGCPMVALYPGAGGWDADMRTDPVDPSDPHYGDPVSPGPGVGGWGFVGGVTDVHGTEIWVTDVSGWDSGATFSASTYEGALVDGTQVTAVLGRGRDITVSGALFAHSGNQGSLNSTKRLVAAALASDPRLGWLSIDNLWLPVAMSGEIKLEQVDSCRIDFEFTVVGRDRVSPGRGIYLESQPPSLLTLNTPVTGGWEHTLGAMNLGTVASKPVCDWTPIPGVHGTLSVSLGGFRGSAQSMKFHLLPRDTWLRVDSLHKQVDLMFRDQSGGDHIVGSGRQYVDWPSSDWLEVPPNASEWTLRTAGGHASVNVRWNGLY